MFFDCGTANTDDRQHNKLWGLFFSRCSFTLTGTTSTDKTIIYSPDVYFLMISTYLTCSVDSLQICSPFSLIPMLKYSNVHITVKREL